MVIALLLRGQSSENTLYGGSPELKEISRLAKVRKRVSKLQTRALG
jgi:hypothetical protein